MRVIVDGDGRLEVVHGQAGVGVRVLGADGATEVVPLAAVVEEVATAEGVTLQVIAGGAVAAEEAARLRARLRAVSESGKQWRALALQAEAEAQSGGGQVLALPVGSALVPLVERGEVHPLLAGLGIGGGVVVMGALASCGGLVAMFSAPWFCVAAWGVGQLVAAWLRNVAGGQRVWTPVADAEGRYRVRVDLHGEAEVLARKPGSGDSWRPAREFAALPQGDLARKVRELEGQLARAHG